MNLWNELQTLLRRTQSIIDTGNSNGQKLHEILHILRPGLKLAAGLIINPTSGAITVSGTTPIILTNVANPSAATYYKAVIDVTGGTTLPTVSVSDTSKLTAVPATSLNSSSQFVVDFFPTDAAAETNDSVTGTISLAGQPDIVLPFTISGTPVPPPETDTLDTSSGVLAWPGAPTVPTAPL